jgi:hypothetical protein
MKATNSYVSKLEEAVQSHFPEKWVETLRRIIDFFLGETHGGYDQ